MRRHPQRHLYVICLALLLCVGSVYGERRGWERPHVLSRVDVTHLQDGRGYVDLVDGTDADKRYVYLFDVEDSTAVSLECQGDAGTSSVQVYTSDCDCDGSVDTLVAEDGPGRVVLVPEPIDVSPSTNQCAKMVVDNGAGAVNVQCTYLAHTPNQAVYVDEGGEQVIDLTLYMFSEIDQIFTFLPTPGTGSDVNAINIDCDGEVVLFMGGCTGASAAYSHLHTLHSASSDFAFAFSEDMDVSDDRCLNIRVSTHAKVWNGQIASRSLQCNVEMYHRTSGWWYVLIIGVLIGLCALASHVIKVKWPCAHKENQYSLF
ncbi:hypothetical protein KIPB_009018 [Kipferlia bialata]|uniref:Uncharacterized protein n=1 Tax=Kipferlia bialata TaxID=797122 RepID=A0A9K3D3C4_9EUKA|nr:hypothetical protein KIPB_009018 [Kipferlia bialata]|eukprot:g9018.t1